LKKKIAVRVDVELLDELTKKYPDIRGYTYAEKVNILLQKLWRQSKTDTLNHEE
jgi:hypothetical protein